MVVFFIASMSTVGITHLCRLGCVAECGTDSERGWTDINEHGSIPCTNHGRTAVDNSDWILFG
jgi:hypothetical protein